MHRDVKVRAGGTEDLHLQLEARGLQNLDGLDQARLYLRRQGTLTNHVDGVVLTVHSSPERLLSFDPVGAAVGGGNALAEPGVYVGYVRCLWTNGRISRHPDDSQQDVRFLVSHNLE
jgi:hypothetical protein